MRVYIAGPVTSSGTQADNMRRALEVANLLALHGHTPFIPHLMFAWEVHTPMTHDQMMAQCKAWLEACEAAVRIPGFSKGADTEEVWARDLNIPFYKHPDERIGDNLVGARLFLADVRTGKFRHPYREPAPMPATPVDTLAHNLGEWQERVREWIEKQPFHPQQAWQPLLGIGEELGELNHAFLKRSQGIRGDAEEHRRAMYDAVGDIMVYLAGFCIAEQISMGECLKVAWTEVSKRDWNANPLTGSKASSIAEAVTRMTGADRGENTP